MVGDVLPAGALDDTHGPSNVPDDVGALARMRSSLVVGVGDDDDVPALEASAGEVGHALPLAPASAVRVRGRHFPAPDERVYVLLALDDVDGHLRVGLEELRHAVEHPPHAVEAPHVSVPVGVGRALVEPPLPDLLPGEAYDLEELGAGLVAV